MADTTRTWKVVDDRWRHIVTIKDKDGTRYYIDGQPATRSDVLGLMNAGSN